MNREPGLLVAGLGLLCSGLVLNEWLVASALSLNGYLYPIQRIVVWCFDVLAISVGSFVVFRRHTLLGTIAVFRDVIRVRWHWQLADS